MIKLYPPVKSVRHQKWGITTRKQTPTWDLILKYGLSQDFGNSEGPAQATYEKWGLKGHSGFDIVLYSGDPIYASNDGTVLIHPPDTSGGLGIDVWNKQEGFITRYWHLQEFVAKHNQDVKVGDIIALGDNTGFSTGAHLHFGLKLKDVNGNTLNKDNGYLGAISPHPYLKNMGILTEQQVKYLYHLTFNRNVDESGLAHYTGKTFEFFYAEIIQSEEYKHYKDVNEKIKILENWARLQTN